MNDEVVDFGRAEALGVSRQAYDEVLDIIGRQPTVDELSTLLAMWDSNGRQQSLYGWLRGQRHTVERDDYLYSGSADHKAVREPRVQECLAIARRLAEGAGRKEGAPAPAAGRRREAAGRLLYMVGNVSSEFAGSEYARRCLHLAPSPLATAGHEEDCAYIGMILQALAGGGLVEGSLPVAEGGLFRSLLRLAAPQGYDILCPREVRLDAFLFGEEPGRFLTAVAEEHDDLFLLKLSEARLNCCFLGRTTKGRVVVDGFDFGPVEMYA